MYQIKDCFYVENQIEVILHFNKMYFVSVIDARILALREGVSLPQLTILPNPYILPGLLSFHSRACVGGGESRGLSGHRELDPTYPQKSPLNSDKDKNHSNSFTLVIANYFKKHQFSVKHPLKTWLPLKCLVT